MTSPDGTPYPVRLGRAFVAFLEHADPARLPMHGGAATTVVVTMDITTLLSGVGVATTLGGDVISAGEARRLACTAGIMPMVLNGASEVLDVGRRLRLHPPIQRTAMGVRDRTCRAEGCEIPAAWCEAHHLEPWHRGGRTSVEDGLLLCSFHHHRIHDPRYRSTLTAERRVTFLRRT